MLLIRKEVAHPMTILPFLQWLQATPFSTGIRESTWWYPVIESVHVLSLCLFLGIALFWDLRLLAMGLRRVPVSDLASRLMPWTFVGFIFMTGSGVLLFIDEPVRFYGNIFFRVKVVALVLAGLNAWFFHYSGVGRRIIDWDISAVTPRGARIAGAVSLFLWAVIVVCGRFIAYNWFKPLV